MTKMKLDTRREEDERGKVIAKKRKESTARTTSKERTYRDEGKSNNTCWWCVGSLQRRKACLELS